MKYLNFRWYVYLFNKYIYLRFTKYREFRHWKVWDLSLEDKRALLRNPNYTTLFSVNHIITQATHDR